MPSIFDLMPASLWPVQPFIPPDEQVRNLMALQSQLAPRDPPWLTPRLDPAPPDPTPAAPQPGPAMSTAGRDSFPIQFTPNANFSSNGIQPPWSPITDPVQNLENGWTLLSLVGGWKSVSDLPPLPAPAPSYGLVPKQPLPPNFKLPPLAPPAWQLPEPDWSLGSPAVTELLNRERAAGLGPNELFVTSHAPGRQRRDAARAANWLLPGSGNFVSGDWDHITANDFADLGLSAVRNLLFNALAPEALAARAAAGEAAGLRGAAGTAQAARAAVSSGGSARATGPLVGKLNAPPVQRIFPSEPLAPPAPLQSIDSAIVPIVTDPYPEAARDLQAFRAQINVPTRNTVAVARTNLPGLEGRVFQGASRLVRKDAGLPPLPRAEPGDIESPFNNPKFVDHAEEDLARKVKLSVNELGIEPENGNVLTIHLSRPPCPPCLSGLDSDAPAGVLKQLSQLFPKLTIHVTWDIKSGIIPSSHPHLIIRNGTYVPGSR